MSPKQFNNLKVGDIISFNFPGSELKFVRKITKINQLNQSYELIDSTVTMGRLLYNFNYCLDSICNVKKLTTEEYIQYILSV